jgi:hypothetical protein
MREEIRCDLMACVAGTGAGLWKGRSRASAWCEADVDEKAT